MSPLFILQINEINVDNIIFMMYNVYGGEVNMANFKIKKYEFKPIVMLALTHLWVGMVSFSIGIVIGLIFLR